ncbi:TetR/AcrR family transcriptional regulator [Nonomuraea sp. NPDC059023]|uniref:TetR/AcrR family transcriptional regulator n=1 Tax=unclassified Nonomuraea TaxID=2593643 RepID=UPI0036B9C9BE
MSAPRRQRVRRGSLSRGSTVEAAVKVLDRDGFEAMTMTAVAGELGARQMSIYNHVRGKDDLFAAVYEHMLAMVPVPVPETGGVAELMALYRDLWQVFRAHPWLVQVGASVRQGTPSQLAIVECTHRIVLRAGVPAAEAVLLVGALTNLVVGTAALDVPGGALGGESDPGAEAEAAREQIAALPEHAFPTLRRLAADLPPVSPDDIVEYGLRVLLARLG